MVFFAWLQSVKVLKHGLFLAFAILFIFLALRYDYGNDYQGYLEGFIEINSYKKVEYFNREFRYEAGWVFLCRVFASSGFFCMIGFLALFNSWVYYRLIRKYVPLRYYWMAVFIYVFSPFMMLTHASAMRQSVSIGLFLLAIDFIINKKIFPYLLMIGMASLFHESALVLLPAYLLAYINVPLKDYIRVALLILFGLLFFLKQNILPLVNVVILSNFAEYELYDEAARLSTGLGILILTFFFCLTLYFDQYQDHKNGILFKLSLISYVFLPLGLILAMLARVGMYFEVIKIAVFPVLLFSLHKSIWKYPFALVFFTFTMVDFYSFFQSEVWRDAFGVYKTIFSSPRFY
jgi:hypothetical protein